MNCISQFFCRSARAAVRFSRAIFQAWNSTVIKSDEKAAAAAEYSSNIDIPSKVIAIARLHYFLIGVNSIESVMFCVSAGRNISQQKPLLHFCSLAKYTYFIRLCWFWLRKITLRMSNYITKI